MQLAGLSLDQAPPISVPFRFFITAPLFLLIAALVLLLEGPAAVVSRWTPAMLAMTHLLTLGFMAMVMMGAMLQMLPVVAGSPVQKPRLIAWLVHPALAAGTLLLAAGFLFGQSVLIKLAIAFLVSGFSVFIMVIGHSLVRAPAHNATVNAMRLAMVSLTITVVLGVMLAAAVSGYADVPMLQIVGLHAVWGLLGWVVLLVIGVAYQVVPMFQLTPVYPRTISRWLAWTVFSLIVLWSIGEWLFSKRLVWVDSAISGSLAGCFIVFSGITLYLQKKRRRRIPDVTLQFWRTGLGCLLADIALWTAGQFLPSINASAVYPVLLGLLFIFGFAVSMITGMLYKIVPYLVWFHLHAKRNKGAVVPNMKEIIPDVVAWRQQYLHTLSVIMLLLVTLWPVFWMAVIASFVLAASSALLWLNLFRATRLYSRCVRSTA